MGKGQGSLANEGTLRARVTFPHIDPIFSDPRLPPRSSPGKLTFRSMGTGQVATFCFLARHGLKRITRITRTYCQHTKSPKATAELTRA